MKRVAAAGVALAIVLAVAAIAFGFAGSGAPLGVFHGARLGMTADETRARFEPGAPGKWLSSGGALEWTADDAAAPVAHARFEFHAGMLVAVRADVAGPSDPALESSRAVVVARRRGQEHVAITILARDCPEHAGEVASLLRAR